MSAPHVAAREAAFRDWLATRLSRYFGRDVAVDVPFAEYGLDSVTALCVYGDIEEEFGPLAEPTDIWEYPTVTKLAGVLARNEMELLIEAGLALRDGGWPAAPRVAFAFTGQGSQHPGMTAGLYLKCATYRRHLDEVSAELQPYTGISTAELILEGDLRIHQTAFAQPALFAVEYALSRTLMDAEILPVAVVGHGIGEYAAAVTAGALTLPDAAKLVAVRGAFTQYLPSGGGMLATGASTDEAAELIAGEAAVSLGVVNAARSTVLSGDLAGLERVQARLAERGLLGMPLKVSHAFQSPLMAPMLPRFTGVARRVPGAPPRLPYYSTVRGRATAEPLYAGYWAEQVTAPVRFAEAARKLIEQQEPTHIVEIGPRTVLIAYLRRMGGRQGPACLPSCRGPESNARDLTAVVEALGGQSSKPTLQIV